MTEVDTTRLVYFEFGTMDMNAHEQSTTAMQLVVEPRWHEQHRRSSIGQQKQWTRKYD
jgi:hypothetical protein